MAVQSVTLAWDPSSDPTIAGYNVYYGAVSGNYSNKVSVPHVSSATIPGLVEGVTYYFAATAYDGAGLESLPSNEISYQVPGVRLTIQSTRPKGSVNAVQIASTGVVPFAWVLESTTDFRTWKTVGQGANSIVSLPVVVSNQAALYFRLRNQTAPAAPAPGATLTISRAAAGAFSNGFVIASAAIVPTAWALEATVDFRTWKVVARGTNSSVNVSVAGTGPPALFFRLKNQ